MIEPWKSIFELIVGPAGAIAALCVTIFFLWRLFREEQSENRKNFATVGALSETVKELSIEVRAWREAWRGRGGTP